MKNVERRLVNLEKPSDLPTTDEQLGKMKEKFLPVLQDIERRLIALESRPTESALSTTTFADEHTPTPMTTLIERIQVLESKVNNLEPSLPTLHSSISSTPLDPPEGVREGDGSLNDPSSTHILSQEQSLQRRIENLEAWVKSSIGGTPSNTLGLTMNELEGRLLKRISNIESQLVHIRAQELPHRQGELESKIEKLLRNDELPSFGASTPSVLPSNLEMRLKKMESNQDNLVAENKKLQARIIVLEESRSSTMIRQITDRLDNVIRMVNNHESDNYQVGQSINDLQQETIALRQTLDAWNEEDPQLPLDPSSEEQPRDQHQEEVSPHQLNEGDAWLDRQRQSWYLLLSYRCSKGAIVFSYVMPICFLLANRW